MKCLYRLLIIFFLLLAFGIQKVAGAEPNTLLTAEKNDAEKSSQIILHFSAIPTFQVKTSGQRIDLTMRGVFIDQNFKNLPEDGTLAGMTRETVRDETSLSFQLRRPLMRVDSSFLLQKTTPQSTAAQSGTQLVLNITWNDESQERLTKDDLPKIRPAILKEMPGTLRISPDATTARRVITSEYAGQWKRFLKEYESGLAIEPSLEYSLPPFPSLALTNPVLIKSLPTPNYQQLEEQGRQEGWDAVVSTIKDILRKEFPPGEREELLLLYGEALIRAGHPIESHELNIKLADGLQASAISSTARYLGLQAQAAAGKPYDAAYELAFLLQEVTPTNPLKPYLELLQVEIAIATNNIDKASLLLDAKTTRYSDVAEQLFVLRKADVLFASGRSDEAYTLYDEVRHHDNLLSEHPDSRAKFASILYQKGMYNDALKQFINLAASLYKLPGQDLAFYAAAMSQYKNVRETQAKLMFENIAKDFPGGDAYFRARLKLNDLFVLSEISAPASPEKDPSSSLSADTAAPDAQSTEELQQAQDYFENFDPAQIYAEIAATAPEREVREEAAFKQALVGYFHNDYTTSITLLEDFLRTNSSGKLVREAEALLVEILPSEIKKQIDGKDYIKALTLVEKNRPLLLSGDIRGDFLTELGLAFASVLFWNRAARVYLYLMDIAKNKTEEEKVYLPLLQAFYEKGDFDQVESYSKKYLADFPNGQDGASIAYLYISALYKNNHTSEALPLLKRNNLPMNNDLHALAGKIYFEAGQYAQAEAQLAKLMANDLNSATPVEIMLRAEALFRDGQGNKALPLYRHLKENAAYRDQAAFRTAQVQMAGNNRAEGLKLLQGLVEKAENPLWRRMAEETLAVAKL
jgi:outer membrane protein assembly factor BamD (BamD/ComL family)